MVNPPPDTHRCPECLTILPASRLDGLCPVCLLNDTQHIDSGEEAGSGTPGPPVGPGLMYLPGYRLSCEIARGGMGIIYEARQINPDRPVAIKMLLPHLMDEPEMQERFRREAQSIAGLDHPGILPVYEVGDHNGLPFFSMKLAPGGTLSGRAAHFRQDWRGMASLLAQLADAIQSAHAHGVLHRDLKPANILFDDAGRAYVSDFGIAKQLAGGPEHLDLTNTSTLLGTPNYLPPEWAAGTARSATTAGDIYGLGAILYQLLTGDPPHRAAQLTTLLRRIADEPVTTPRSINAGIPRDLEVICLKALAKDPDQRYATAQDLASDLRAWLGGRPIQARSVSPAAILWFWARRNPLAASLALVLALSLATGGTVLWKSLQTSRQSLHDSLVAQASALRETGRLGNRTKAVAALESALELRHSDAARTELSSALAMTDLEEIRRLAYGTNDRVHTDAAFSRFTFLDGDGEVTIRDLRDGKVLSTAPGEAMRAPGAYGPFSPDGRFLVLRKDGSKTFHLWDCEDHTFRQRDVPGDSPLFAPDSRTMATGFEDGTLEIRDAITGAVLFRHPTGMAHVRPHSFSPDGKNLIAGKFKGSQFLVMEVSTGRILRQDNLPKAANVRCAAWRPDGTGFFIGTESFKIYEWAFPQPGLPRQYTGHEGNVLALAVHPGGEWLLSQSEDGTTRLWNTATARTVATLPYYGTEVRFSPDGQEFLCEDRESRIMQVIRISPSPVCRQFPIPHPDADLVASRGCWIIRFSPDGGLFSVGDTAGLFHFETFTGRLLGHAPVGYCWSLGWAPDGSALYSVSMGKGLQRWASAATSDLGALPDSGRTLLPPVSWKVTRPGEAERYDDLNHMTVSEKGDTLAVVYDGHIALLAPPQGQLTKELPKVEGLLDAVAISPDSSLVAASRQHGPGVPVFETATGKRLPPIPTQYPEATVLFYPDSRRVLTGDLGGVTCWEARTGSVLWQAPCPVRSPTTVQIAISRDGRLVAANLTSDTVSVMDALTGAGITQLRHPFPQPVGGLAFSPDTSSLGVLCLGHLVQLWDLRRLRLELDRRGIDWAHPPLPGAQTPREWSFASPGG